MQTQAPAWHGACIGILQGVVCSTAPKAPHTAERRACGVILEAGGSMHAVADTPRGACSVLPQKQPQQHTAPSRAWRPDNIHSPYPVGQPPPGRQEWWVGLAWLGSGAPPPAMHVHMLVSMQGPFDCVAPPPATAAVCPSTAPGRVHLASCAGGAVLKGEGACVGQYVSTSRGSDEVRVWKGSGWLPAASEVVSPGRARDAERVAGAARASRRGALARLLQQVSQHDLHAAPRAACTR